MRLFLSLEEMALKMYVSKSDNNHFASWKLWCPLLISAIVVSFYPGKSSLNCSVVLTHSLLLYGQRNTQNIFPEVRIYYSDRYKSIMTRVQCFERIKNKNLPHSHLCSARCSQMGWKSGKINHKLIIFVKCKGLKF